MKEIKEDAVIKKIIFDLVCEGKKYDNLELAYEDDGKYKYPDDWCLTWEDIHMEDNDSWCMVETPDGLLFDMQIYGINDSLGTKAPLRMQANLMERDGINCNHTDKWLFNDCFSNIRIIFNDGKELSLENHSLIQEIKCEFDQFCQDNGKLPNVAYVSIQWDDEEKPQDGLEMIELDGDGYNAPFLKEELADDDILFYASDIDNLLSLCKPDNGNDFHIVACCQFGRYGDEKHFA